MVKCLAKVLAQPVVTALVMGGPTALTPCKTARPSQKEPFTSAQGKLSLRTPQISLYFTVVRPSDGKRPPCPSQILLNITHGGSEGTNRPSGMTGWKTAMNLIHLFLALFPICLNAVITASGSSCGENVKTTMKSKSIYSDQLIYFICS